MPHEAFVDTGFWFAYLVRNDSCHHTGAALMEELMAEGTLLSTSDLVLSETYTLLMRKVGTAAALQFLDLIALQVKEKFTEIYYVDWPVLVQSRNLLSKYADHQLSFTDAASAALVRAHSIPAIATFDRHFQILGLPCLGLST